MRIFFFSVIFSILATGCGWNSSSDSVGLEPEMFKTEIAVAGSQLIDVRTPEEYMQGHISGAVNIDYFSKDFETHLKQFDTEKKIYMYCRSGKRSSKSVSKLKALGFSQIYELDGGIINWRSKGLKTAK